MREITLIATNYSLFSIFIIILCGLQSSLWFHIFGSSPAPYFWIAVINYWTLYRSLPEAAIMNYISALILVTMSGIPLDMSFALHISLFGSIYLLRDRVLWSGPNSFMFSCGISAFLVPIVNFIWSRVLEDHPITNFYFFDWITRGLLTAAFSLPLFYFFSLIDKFTQKVPPKDTESGII